MRLSLTLVDGRTGRPVDALRRLRHRPAGGATWSPRWSGLLGEQVHDTFARRVPVWVDGAEVDLRASCRAGRRPQRRRALALRAGRSGRPAGSRGRRRAARRLRVRAQVASTGCRSGRPSSATAPTGWSLPDLRLPARALTVDVAIDGTVPSYPADGLGARLDDEDLEDEGAEWPVGGHLAAGGTVLARGEVVAPVADVEARPEEALIDFNRQPRMLPPDRERAFHLPDKPAEIRKRPLPWVMVVVPLLVAMPMALLLRAAVADVRAALPGDDPGQLRAATGSAAARRRWRSSRSTTRRTPRSRHGSPPAWWPSRPSAGCRAPTRRQLLINAIGPGPGSGSGATTTPTTSGSGSVWPSSPPAVKVEERREKTEEEAPPRMLELVPAWLDLTQLGVVGVAGDLETARRIAHWIVAQAALLHSPRDVRVTVLSDAEGEGDWSWVRWLPHARIGGDAEALALGTQQDSVGRRLAELTALIRPARGGAARQGTPQPRRPGRARRGSPPAHAARRRGPAAAWSRGRDPCCSASRRRSGSCPRSAAPWSRAPPGRCGSRRVPPTAPTGIVPDLVEVPWCETVARAISPLRDTTPEEEATGLPGSARLLEDIALDPPTPEAIAPRWANGRTTDVVVGAGYDGPFRLDLRRDGPHALIAGTTGSGKSEFLQTLVASLAVANRPDELTFVLVDYKGGSAFKDCARLPHTVGMVTDLDNHLVGRALVSLGAELRRREHLLAAPGAKDLEDYWALQRSRPDLPAIPRLVLVIDEFASMVAELPDFVDGLVSIAQRGRSLGIHLVLATQRPSGVVSADIRANTNLRISLRVTDENDSRDVIDAPDAARIQKNQPGRAFVRSGASTLMPFQSGRVGGRSPDAEAGPKKADEPLAWAVPWAEVGLPAPDAAQERVRADRRGRHRPLRRRRRDRQPQRLARNPRAAPPVARRPARPGRDRRPPGAAGRRRPRAPRRGLGARGPARAPGAAAQDLRARPGRAPLRHRRPAQRSVHRDADPRRLAGGPGRRARPARLRTRLRQRLAPRADATSRTPAPSSAAPRSTAPHRLLSRLVSVGGGAAGPARRRRVRRPGRAACVAAAGGAAAVPAVPARPLGRLRLQPRRGRQRPDDRAGDEPAARRSASGCTSSSPATAPW